MRRDEMLRTLALSDESIGRALRDAPARNLGTAFYLDYPVTPTPRAGWGKPPQPEIVQLLDAERDQYRACLCAVADYTDELSRIPAERDPHTVGPAWINGWLPALDSAVLYGVVARNRPKLYLEIGSGNSTLFARQAIIDHDLATRITSIDPAPRAEIDAIVDLCFRHGLEDVDTAIFSELAAGDVLFFDGSHRCMTNSDATVMFTEILPRLAPGVLVQIHDIWLPDDYPPGQADRIYSEQYLLATMLLSGGMGYEVLLPNWYVTHDAPLAEILQPLWSRVQAPGLETHGCSFWLRRRSN
jgi:predicted O-methyltransferase YrrM